MTEILITNGIVVTMDDDRSIHPNGAVVVSGTEILEVGASDALRSEYDPDQVIDADGGIVLPGLINTHVHVADVLHRGLSDQRSLHDWLFNIKRPLVGAMTPDDHALAAALYCRESLLAGVTTFVENAGGTGSGYAPEVIDRKMEVYDRMGVRNIYSHGFLDAEGDEEMARYIDVQIGREPDIEHVTGPAVETQEALSRTEALIEEYHGTAGGRQQVWPGPFLAWGVTPEGLAGAYELAEKYDVMTTTHTAESPPQERRLASSVEYLDSTGYLGERTLLGHCVQLSESDIRALARTDTKVAHNVVTNCSLGSGIAPVPTMRGYGVTVGLGTDNIDQNDTINMINDMRFAAMIHRGARKDPTAVSALDALEMATIDAAEAIGCSDEIGSIEAGKKADLIVLDTDQPYQLPYGDPVSMIVCQAQGTEVSTVLCHGQVVVENGSINVGDKMLPDSEQAVWRRRAELLERTGHDKKYPNDWAFRMTE